jgi:DNA replication initiation complex subunit (GINS family)
VNISELLKLWRVEKGSSELAAMPGNFYSEAVKLTEDKNPYDAKKAKELYNNLVHMRQHKMLMACLRQLQGGHKPDNLLANEKEIYKEIYDLLLSVRAGKVDVIEETSEEEPEEESEQGKLESEELKGGIEAEETESEEKQEETEGQETTGETETKDVAGEEKPEDAETEQPEKEAESGQPETSQGDKPVFKGETENKALKRVRFLKSMPAFVGPDLDSLGPFEEGQETELDEGVVEILLKNDAVELV